jgi:hypothetical protein
LTIFTLKSTFGSLEEEKMQAIHRVLGAAFVVLISSPVIAQNAKTTADCAKITRTVSYSNQGGNWATSIRQNKVTHSRVGGGAASIERTEVYIEGGYCRWRAYFPQNVSIFSSVVIFEETIQDGPGNGGFQWIRR